MSVAHSVTASRPVVPPFVDRLRTAVSAIRILTRDAGRLDQVLVLAQAVNAQRVADAVVKFEATEEGRFFFSERPRIDRKHVDFDALRAMPDGTLGREYTRFLDDNGITPDAFEALPDVGDTRAAWIMLRLRQTHDLWHVLTGYKPDVHGELLLQAFTYAQIEAPSSLILLLVGTLRWMNLKPSWFKELRRAHERGKATRFLPTVRWETLWATPVTELRAMLTCPA